MSGSEQQPRSEGENSIPKEWQSLIQDGIYDEDHHRTESYEQSFHGQKELAKEENAKFVEKRLEELDRQLSAGQISQESYNKIRGQYEEKYNKILADIDNVRQDYRDSVYVGTPEETDRYEQWLKSKEAENQANLEATGRKPKSIDTENDDTGDNESPKQKHETDDAGENENNDDEDKNDDPEESKNKVEIGEIDIDSIEQEFADSKAERLKELEGQLEKMRPELAELYARNRRLIVGSENRAAFMRVKGEYGKLMDEYLKLKGKETYEAGRHEIADRLETRIEELKADIEEKLTEFAGGDLDATDKTQEEIDAEKERLTKEAEKTLRTEYDEMLKALEGKVNADFVEDYIKQESELEDATIDKLDNGSLCRKFVNKVLNNKVLKGVLITAAVAGLAVSGVGIGMGLAAGTVAIGANFTAAGVLAGAAKGGLMGGLMSRQNSKNSAVRGFASEEEIRQSLEGINILDQESDEANVADYLLSQYEEANADDRSSNRKKTLISAGIGAALGALASGVQVNNINHDIVSEQQLTGYEPVEYHAANLDQVNIPQGHGMYDTFTQLGGDPSAYNNAQDIAWSIDGSYGLSPGSNGVVPGFDGTVGAFAHTYPGPISSWPPDAQAYITEVADAWAANGLIPSYQTGGGPIYDTVTRVVENYVPNAFYNFLTRATAIAGAGAIGSLIGGRRNGETRDDSGSPSPDDSPTPINEGPDNSPETEITDGTEDTTVLPTPTPETGNTNPADDVEEVTGEVAESVSDGQPEASAESDSERENLSNVIRSEIVNDISDDSLRERLVEIMSSSADPNSRPNYAEMINLWTRLDAESREKISNFEGGQESSPFGSDFREFLRLFSEDLAAIHTPETSQNPS